MATGLPKLGEKLHPGQELLSKKQCEYLVDLFEQFADLTFERAAAIQHEE